MPSLCSGAVDYNTVLDEAKAELNDKARSELSKKVKDMAQYGTYAFIHRGIGRYMLMLDHFVFFDFDEPLIYLIVDYITAMGMFVFVGHYVVVG